MYIWVKIWQQFYVKKISAHKTICPEYWFTKQSAQTWASLETSLTFWPRYISQLQGSFFTFFLVHFVSLFPDLSFWGPTNTTQMCEFFFSMMRAWMCLSTDERERERPKERSKERESACVTSVGFTSWRIFHRVFFGTAPGGETVGWCFKSSTIKGTV